MNYFVRSVVVAVTLFGSSGLIFTAAEQKEKDFVLPDLSYVVEATPANFAHQQAARKKMVVLRKGFAWGSVSAMGLGAALQYPGLPDDVCKAGRVTMALGGLGLCGSQLYEAYRPLPKEPIAPGDEPVTRGMLRDMQSRNVQAMQGMLKSLAALEKKGEKNLDEKEKSIKAHLETRLTELRTWLATQYAPIATKENPYITLASLRQLLQTLEERRNETRHNAIFAASDPLRLQIDACVKTSDFDRFTKTCATINALQQLRSQLAQEAKQEQERVNGRFDAVSNDLGASSQRIDALRTGMDDMARQVKDVVGISANCVQSVDNFGLQLDENQRATMQSLGAVSLSAANVSAELAALTPTVRAHEVRFAQADARRAAHSAQRTSADRLSRGLAALPSPSRRQSLGSASVISLGALIDDRSSNGGDVDSTKQADASEQPEKQADPSESLEKPGADGPALAESGSGSQPTSLSSGPLSSSLSDTPPVDQPQADQLRRGGSRRNVRAGTGNHGPVIARRNRNQQG